MQLQRGTTNVSFEFAAKKQNISIEKHLTVSI